MVRQSGQASGSPLSESLRALLTAYTEALSLARSLPLFVRRWFRPFVHLILVNHIARRVSALHRHARSRAAVAENPSGWEADLKRLELFEQSIPPTRQRTWVVALLTVSFVAAWILAGTAFEARESARLIENVTKATATVSPEGVIDAFDPPDDKKADRPGFAAVVGAGWIALYAVIVALLAPSSSYRLKHILVTVAPRSRSAAEQAGLRDQPDHGSIVELEQRAFDAVGGRRPPERSLDLVAQTLLALPVASFGVLGAWISVAEFGEGYTLENVGWTLVFLVPAVLSLAGVIVTWRARVGLEAAVPSGVWRRPIELMMTAGVLGPLFLNVLLIIVLLSERFLP